MRVCDRRRAFRRPGRHAARCAIKWQKHDHTVLCSDKMAALHPVQRARDFITPSSHPPHLLYEEIFFFLFFAVWLLIIDRCNGFGLLLLCAQNINASLPSLSL